jgi:DNA-binding Lrp family transcriptional regulator
MCQKSPSVNDKDLPPNKTPPPPQINRIYNVRVICPHCKTEQDYRFKDTTKRKHKYCTNPACPKGHFDITRPDQEKVKKEAQAETLKAVEMELAEVDKRIMKGFYNPTTKGFEDRSKTQLAKLVGLHKTTIGRHIDKLVKLSLIIGVKNTIGNFNGSLMYRINPKIPQAEEKAVKTVSGDGKVNAVSMHNWRVQLAIPDYKQTLNILKQSLFFKPINKSHMKNWDYTYFIENDLEFRLSTKNIFCNPIGVGTDDTLALKNLQEKAVAIREHFRAKYQLQLGEPVFLDMSKYPDGDDRKEHYVPLRDTPAKIAEYQLAWSDRTHPGAIETASKAFVKRVLGLEEKVVALEVENAQLKCDLHEIQQQAPTIDMNSVAEKVASTMKNDLNTFQANIRTEMIQEIGPAIGHAIANEIKKLGIGQMIASAIKDFFDSGKAAANSLPSNDPYIT